MSDGDSLSEDAHALSDEEMVVRPGVNGPELARQYILATSQPPRTVFEGFFGRAAASVVRGRPAPCSRSPQSQPTQPAVAADGGRSHSPQSQSKPEAQLTQLARHAQQAQQAPGAPGTTGTVEAEGEKEYEDAHSYRRTSGHDDDSKGGDNGKSGKGKSKEARLERQRQEQERDMKRNLPSFMHDCVACQCCVSGQQVACQCASAGNRCASAGNNGGVRQCASAGNRFYQTRLFSGQQVAIETVFSGDRGPFCLHGNIEFRHIHSHHVNYVDKVTGKLKYENNLPLRSIGKVVSMLMPDGVSMADMATQVCEAAVDNAVTIVLGDESATVVVPNFVSNEGIDLDATSLPPTPPAPT